MFIVSESGAPIESVHGMAGSQGDGSAGAGAAKAAPAPADAQLVARALRGEAGAFEAIMRRYNRLLFRCVRGVLGDDAEAQDVVQETYLRAFSTLAGFRGDCALGTWLARIAFHAAIDAQRRRGRTVSLDDESEEGTESDVEPMMNWNVSTAESPDSQAERGEMRVLLTNAIEALPPIYRSVFILRAVEEMSVEETADCLEVSDAVVKTRYLRARTKLRDALGDRLEPRAREAYAFAGSRCDAVVAGVLDELRRQGLVCTDAQERPATCVESESRL
ncbi:RNA polymerase sigma factor [Zeimonas arvi]|nr:RNA polymerase sigma factor [Zeimonas arvi]